VTAAHCVRNADVSGVRLGETNMKKEFDCIDSYYDCPGNRRCFEEQECADKHVDVKVSDVIIHDKYRMCDRCVPEFDVALLVLKSKVEFSDFIRPICLPSIDSEPKNDNFVVIGFGNTAIEFGKFEPANILQKLDVDYVENTKCDNQWSRRHIENNLLTTHICATGLEIGTGTCKGDSGGPLMRLFDIDEDRWELVGITSFGVDRCGNIDLPLGFTRILGQVNSWLRGIIRDELK